jgi:hypothetical protein
MLKDKFAKVGEKLDNVLEKTSVGIEDFIKEVDATISDIKSKTSINGIDIHIDENKNVKLKGDVHSISLNDTFFYKKEKE